MYIKLLQEEIHRNSQEKGWWDEPKSFGDVVALCHSELSEALEEFRNGNVGIYYKAPDGSTSDVQEGEHQKPEGIPIELADVIIRILDYCGEEDIDIGEAIRIKNAFNRTRPYRHGGKRL